MLIPIPQHGVRATYALTLSRYIGRKAGARTLDILSSAPREKVYSMKKKGVSAKDISLGFSAEYAEDYEQWIRNARNVILIDNVIDSGTTYEQARRAVEETYGVSPWLLTLGAILNPDEDPYDVIRSEYRP